MDSNDDYKTSEEIDQIVAKGHPLGDFGQGPANLSQAEWNDLKVKPNHAHVDGFCTRPVDAKGNDCWMGYQGRYVHQDFNAPECCGGLMVKRPIGDREVYHCTFCGNAPSTNLRLVRR